MVRLMLYQNIRLGYSVVARPAIQVYRREYGDVILPVNENAYESSSTAVQYTSDGEKIEFTPNTSNSKDNNQISPTVESARAKAFDECTSRVVIMKVDP